MPRMRIKRSVFNEMDSLYEKAILSTYIENMTALLIQLSFGVLYKQ